MGHLRDNPSRIQLETVSIDYFNRNVRNLKYEFNLVTHSNFSCRYCRYYDFVGHRGGECQRLGVAVQGQWAGCPLMVPNVNPTTRTCSKPPVLSEVQSAVLLYLRVSSSAKLDLPPNLASA
jgi:hypothetical protein